MAIAPLAPRLPYCVRPRLSFAWTGPHGALRCICVRGCNVRGGTKTRANAHAWACGRTHGRRRWAADRRAAQPPGGTGAEAGSRTTQAPEPGARARAVAGATGSRSPLQPRPRTARRGPTSQPPPSHAPWARCRSHAQAHDRRPRAPAQRRQRQPARARRP